MQSNKLIFGTLLMMEDPILSILIFKLHFSVSQ